MAISSVNSGFPSSSPYPDPSMNGALPMASHEEPMPADALGIPSSQSGAALMPPQGM